MKPTFVVLMTIALLLQSLGTRATLIVDSFTEDDFSLSLDGFSARASAVTGPLGATLRFARISDRLAADGSVLTSTLSTSAGSLSFVADGASISEDRPLDLTVSYSDGGPFSILGYQTFEFDVSAVSGTGSLFVVVGNQSSFYGPETHRIPLISPGTLEVPFDQLNFGSDGSIDSFLSMHIRFEAETTQFSFTLDEIRLVPEPTTFACLLLGAAGLLAMSRIRRQTAPS